MRFGDIYFAHMVLVLTLIAYAVFVEHMLDDVVGVIYLLALSSIAFGFSMASKLYYLEERVEKNLETDEIEKPVEGESDL